MVSRQVVDRTSPEILVLYVGSNGELQGRRGMTSIQRDSLPKLLAYRLQTASQNLYPELPHLHNKIPAHWSGSLESI